MPIVYKQHLDSRDGTIYNCVQMPDGKWWAAKNLQWAGAGRPYNSSPANEAIYGRLYSWAEANTSCPPGTHLPTNAEWTTLETAIPAPDGTKLKAVSSLWTPNTGTDEYGFAALPGGNHYGDPSNLDYGINVSACFWTATNSGSNSFRKELTATGSAVITTALDDDWNGYWNSVRFIVDTFNEPIPPTKIHGTFSGSGVKVFASRPSDTTFEVPLSAQSTTELTISKDFITTFGPSIGRVRILVVDGEYISEWKDWDFRI